MKANEVRTTDDLCQYLTERLKGEDSKHFWSKASNALEELDLGLRLPVTLMHYNTAVICDDADEPLLTIKVTRKKGDLVGTYYKIQKYFIDKIEPLWGYSLDLREALAKKSAARQAQKQKDAEAEICFLNLLSEHGFKTLEEFGEWITTHASSAQVRALRSII